MQFVQFQVARADTGEILPYAKVYVYLTGTGTLASLFDASNVATTNPVIADATGQVGFAAADGIYDFQAKSADGLYTDPTIIKQQVFDLSSMPGSVATRSAMAALSGVNGMVRYLSEAGREGLFVFSNANLSAKVTADTAQGIYVAPASASTGAAGAWVRKFTSAVDPKWFGLSPANSAAANIAAWNAMATCLGSRAIAVGQARTLEAIRFTDDGAYNFGANTIDLLEGKYDIAGVAATDDSTGTTLQFSGATGLRVQRHNTSGASGTRTSAYGADGSIIRNLRLLGGYVATEGEFHGIHLRAAAFVQDCTFVGFEGDGVFVDGTGGNNFPDLSRFRICRSAGNRKGFFTDGGDANVCSFDGCDARANRTWGYYDSSFLGNTYVACHAASNGWDGAIGSRPTAATLGGNRYYIKPGQEVAAKTTSPSGTTADNAVWGFLGAGGIYNGVVAWVTGTYDFREGGAYKTDDPNARNLIIGCYSEGDQDPSQLVGPTMLVGGLHGANVKGSGVVLEASTNLALLVDKLIIRANVNNSLQIQPRDATATFDVFASGNTLQFYNGSTIFGTWASNGDLITSGVLQMTGELAIRASGSSALRIDARDATNGFYQFVDTSTLKFYSNSAVRATLTSAGAFNVTGAITASNLSGTNTGDQTITLTGNVTGSGTGSFATTIAAGAVTLAMQANMATGSLVYRKTAGAGPPEVQTLATLKTDLGLTGTNSGDQTITLTGDVTGSGTGSFATTLAAATVVAKIATQAIAPASVAATGAITSSGAGVGYATGAGAAVTQLTSKSTAPPAINKPTGQITTNNAALAAAGVVSFTVSNSTVVATDTITLNLQSGNATAGTYRYWIDKVSAGSFVVVIENRSAGSLSEALVFNFAVLKAVNA